MNWRTGNNRLQQNVCQPSPRPRPTLIMAGMALRYRNPRLNLPIPG